MSISLLTGKNLPKIVHLSPSHPRSTDKNTHSCHAGHQGYIRCLLEVNLRNPLHSRGFHTGYEIKARCRQKSKTGDWYRTNNKKQRHVGIIILPFHATKFNTKGNNEIFRAKFKSFGFSYSYAALLRFNVGVSFFIMWRRITRWSVAP